MMTKKHCLVGDYFVKNIVLGNSLWVLCYMNLFFVVSSLMREYGAQEIRVGNNDDDPLHIDLR